MVVFVFVGEDLAEFAFNGKKIRAASSLGKSPKVPVPSSSQMTPQEVEEAPKIDVSSGDISIKRDPLKSRAKAQAATARVEKEGKKKRKLLVDCPSTAEKEGKKKSRSSLVENPSNLSTIPEGKALPDRPKDLQAFSPDASALPPPGEGSVIILDMRSAPVSADSSGSSVG